MGRTARAVVAIAALLAGGCREGVPPFTPVEREEPADGPWQLTFGYGQDADPQWSPGGDSVIYHTNAFATRPGSSGALARIAARGGAAETLLPLLQDDVQRALATPAYSPAGDRVAYMDLMSVDAPGFCQRVDRLEDGGEALPFCAPMQPLLDSIVLRVRTVDESRHISEEPRVAIRMEGTDAGNRFGTSGPWYERLFPFQAAYRAEHAMLFRPSWAPDGERIAFSDGLGVRIWRIGDAAAMSVPGTEDGVSAAWSPDGEWIAFARLPRADSITYECSCPGDVTAYRTIYTAGPRTLVIVRPDGSALTELGPGSDPAWSPDGSHIYVSRAEGIVQVPRSGGSGVQIPDTERGRAPAVSPDGARLAFMRPKSQLILDYDLWIVSLSQ